MDTQKLDNRNLWRQCVFALIGLMVFVTAFTWLLSLIIPTTMTREEGIAARVKHQAEACAANGLPPDCPIYHL